MNIILTHCIADVQYNRI